MKNGNLLAAASQKFTVFITADKKLQFQQNLTDNRLSIIVLPTNQVPLVIALLAAIRKTLTTIQPGDLGELPLP
ncbi:MAG: hypothetical protein R3B74_01480 [Nitrospirales bacterium]|nr:hypothetical protein [Nitrospirales bacterium]